MPPNGTRTTGVRNEFNRRWDTYEATAGTNHKPLKKERWALRETMSGDQRLSQHAHRPGEAPPQPPEGSHQPLARAREEEGAPSRRQATVGLCDGEEGEHRAAGGAAPAEEERRRQFVHERQYREGDRHRRHRNVRRLASKVSRVESIARELQAWSRRRRSWSPHRRRPRARRGAADHEHHEPRRTTRGTVLFLFFGTSPTSQTKARFRKDIPIGSSDQYGRDAGHANRGYPKAVHD